MRQRHFTAGVAALVVVIAGCTSEATSSPPTAVASSSSRPTPAASTTSGDVTLTYPVDAFPAGTVPRIQAVEPGQESGFESAFRIATASGAPTTVDVTAATQPLREVEISFALPASLPYGTVPVVFYFDEELDLWLPTPSTVIGDRLVGRVSHFTRFTAGVMEALEATEEGTLWLQFQVANLTGARAATPECAGTPLATSAANELNDALLVCAARADSGDIEVTFVANRPYSWLLDTPTAPTTIRTAPGDTTSAVYRSVAGFEPVAALGLLAPARTPMTATWEGKSLQPGPMLVTGRTSPGMLVVDTVVTAVAVAAGTGDGAIAAGSALADCLAGALEAAGTSWTSAPSSFVTAANDCLQLAVREMPASAKKLAKAVEVGLLLGRAGQSAVDGIFDSSNAPAVTIYVDGDAPAIAAAADPLYTRLDSSTGAGPSGEQADATIGGWLRANDSTTQWVGCEGEPAVGVFDLDGQPTRLTATLGKRDFAPAELVMEVQARVDGRLVETYTVRNDPITVALELPRGVLLELSAVTDGECGPADAGYLLWGNAALTQQ